MVSDEDNPDAWRQVAAWAQVAGAVKDHRAQLVRAREALTAAWPPETNKSADAFVNELDKLIKGMDTAREDADTTATGLANILEALRQAKDKIEPLYEEYRQKNDDWVPGWWDNAEDEIDQKAQAHMIAAEQIVEQNVPQLRVPEPYVMDPAAKSAYVPGRTDPTGDALPAARFGSGGGSGVGASGAATRPCRCRTTRFHRCPGTSRSCRPPADAGARVARRHRPRRIWPARCPSAGPHHCAAGDRGPGAGSLAGTDARHPARSAAGGRGPVPVGPAVAWPDPGRQCAWSDPWQRPGIVPVGNPGTLPAGVGGGYAGRPVPRVATGGRAVCSRPAR